MLNFGEQNHGFVNIKSVSITQFLAARDRFAVIEFLDNE
jgi:hypothetical protein